MPHVYNNTFFDYIDHGARASARALTGLLGPMIRPESVLDLGSGRGVWLDEWRKAGIAEVIGIDGDYVDRTQLAIPESSFLAADLTKFVDTGRRFDLAQSLEVGEHLPNFASQVLVRSLTSAADRVLFSAAVTGQGGEFHINEQPLSYWQSLFEERGYRAYDCLRPHLKNNREIEPWYRYNAILYVNEAGRIGLPDEVLKYELPIGEQIQDGGDLMWRARRAIVSKLPRNLVTEIAQARAAYLAARSRRNIVAKGKTA